MSSNIEVIKRDGRKEQLDIEKFHRVCSWSCEGLTGVSSSELELKTQIQFHDKIKTSFIMEILIKAAADLISEDAPNYQYVGGRLVNYHLRKNVYGQHLPIRLYDHVKNVVKEGYYDPELLKLYTEEEFDTIDTYINHDRDFNITYVGMEQFRGKYLVKNRTNGKIFETPQMAFILISAMLFSRYPKENRLKWVKNYYDAVSTFDISLPTPIMAGVRTPQRQYSSCTLIETGDSLDEINATSSAIVKYASQKAGIGIGAGRIRAIGSPVRNGDVSHTGVIPFYKYFTAAVKSCAQGGVRMSSATLHYPIWHYEIEDLLVLKNNKGIEENRIRHLDYSVQFNKIMYERLIGGRNITLFSPPDIPGLYESFFTNVDKFRELYEKAEKNNRIRKKSISAIQLFSMFMQERKETGRIYLMNVDHANDHGAFVKEKAPIFMSNLCLTGDQIITILDKDSNIHDIRLDEIGLYVFEGECKIWSRNIKTGNDEFATIKEFAKTQTQVKVLKIIDDHSGKSIKCTPEHLIYTKNRGYVMAKDLEYNDELCIAE